MPTQINAAFVGDSHGMIIQAAAADAGITFKHPITAASAMFAESRFAPDDAGKPTFQPAAGRIDPEVHAANKIAQRLKKAHTLTGAFQSLFANPVHVFANIGTTARTLVQRIVTSQKSNGQTGQAMSIKLAKRAAKEFFQDFRQQYAEIALHCPEVIFFYGPTRFTPETRDLWLAYDEAIAAEIAEIAVDMLDLRSTLGDDDLLLLPEYYPEPDDDVHANAKWGMDVMTAIQAHKSLQTGT